MVNDALERTTCQIPVSSWIPSVRIGGCIRCWTVPVKGEIAKRDATKSGICVMVL